MIIIFLYFIFSDILLGYSMFIDSIFRENPSETITLDNVEYSFYNYRVTWEEARIICLDYGSQLAILDTEEKAIFITHETSDSSLAYDEFWIGSKMTYQGYWIWVGNNKKIIHNHFLHEMIITPHYSNQSFENNFYCLTIFRKGHNVPMLIPLRCQEQRFFICQKDKLLFGINIVNVFSIKIENKDFVLYSGKLTWSESVVQCRKRGLQIAEISNSNQAQSLAIGMLKVRPRAIENAWIGGYMKNHVWKWLPTGKNITENEMWQNENMIYGDCLLIDRHVCELPTYLSAKCDRKRNFFCETCKQTVETEINTNLISVTLDACRYWIGFYPVSWFEAKQYCEKLESTLIVLDSVTTMNHVLHIMIDNREKLQHIWLDGKRESNHTNLLQKEPDSNVWKWESFDIQISGPGESFIPWCNDSRFYEIDAQCLNMDREDFNVPLVYGINCNTKQTFICQQWTSSCDKIKKLNETFSTKNFKTKTNFNTLTKENTYIKDEKLNTKSNQEVNFKYSLNNINIENSTEKFIISSIYTKTILDNISPQYVSKFIEKSVTPVDKLNIINYNDNITDQYFDKKMEIIHNNTDTDIFDTILKNHSKSISTKIKNTVTMQIPFIPSTTPSINKNLMKYNDNKSLDNSFDKDISLRIYDDKIKNIVNLKIKNTTDNIENITHQFNKTNFNSKYIQSSTPAIMGFKEIIEFMVKNIEANNSKQNNILLNNTQFSKLKDQSNNTKVDKKNQTIIVHEHVSKIVKSNINKKIQNNNISNSQFTNLSETKRSQENKFYSNISYINILEKYLNNSKYLKYPVTSIDINTSAESVLIQDKKTNSSNPYTDNSNNIFKLNKNIENIENNKNSFIQIINNNVKTNNTNNYNKYFYNKYLNPVTYFQRKYLNNNNNNNTDNLDLKHFIISEKINNSINNNKLHYSISKKKVHNIKRIISEETVQSLNNSKNEKKNNLNFNEIFKNFKTNFSELDLEKPLSFTLKDTDLDKNIMNPWNVLLKHIFQSLNTKTKINKKKGQF